LESQLIGDEEVNMSTRCQVGFYPNDEEDLTKWEALIYRHMDGYPGSQHGVIAELMPILQNFDKNRGLSDIEYAAAWLVRCWKENELNIGICRVFHGDIEYFYAVYKDHVDVYSCGFGSSPENWKHLITVDMEATSEELEAIDWDDLEGEE